MIPQNILRAIFLYVVQGSLSFVMPGKASFLSIPVRQQVAIACKQIHLHQITLAYHSQKTRSLHQVV